MRTVRSSGHFRGMSAQGVGLRGCLPEGVSARGSTQRQTPRWTKGQTRPRAQRQTPTFRGQTDRHLWNHYLSATTVADGNKMVLRWRSMHLKKYVQRKLLTSDQSALQSIRSRTQSLFWREWLKRSIWPNLLIYFSPGRHLGNVNFPLGAPRLKCQAAVQ